MYVLSYCPVLYLRDEDDEDSHAYMYMHMHAHILTKTKMQLQVARTSQVSPAGSGEPTRSDSPPPNGKDAASEYRTACKPFHTKSNKGNARSGPRTTPGATLGIDAWFQRPSRWDKMTPQTRGGSSFSNTKYRRTPAVVRPDSVPDSCQREGDVKR